jgi:hypothetical protein
MNKLNGGSSFSANNSIGISKQQVPACRFYQQTAGMGFPSLLEGATMGIELKWVVGEATISAIQSLRFQVKYSLPEG